MVKRKPGNLVSEGMQIYVKPVGDENHRMRWKVQVKLTREDQREIIEKIAQMAALEVKVNHGSYWGVYPCCEILCPISPFDSIGHLLYRLSVAAAHPNNDMKELLEQILER